MDAEEGTAAGAEAKTGVWTAFGDGAVVDKSDVTGTVITGFWWNGR